MQQLTLALFCLLFGAGVHAQSIPASTSGVVYLRSDTIAYPANYVPASGLPDAEVSLSGSSTTTNGAGWFSIASSTTPTRDSVPLTASLPGFMTTWYPWLPDDAKQPLPVALYPEVTATPRPGFVKGIVPHDMGGGPLPSVYAEGLFPTTFDRIRDVAGGNLVAFSDPAWVTAFDVATNSVTMVEDPNSNWKISPRSLYESIAGQAKGRGLQFMMMLGIYSSLDNFHLIGSVSLANNAFWDAWFAAYRPFILQRTAIARDLGIEYVGIGLHQGYMTNLGPERWRSLIDEMRAAGYQGKIVYFAMAGGEYGGSDFQHYVDADTGPVNPLEFIRLFDAIGISVYDGVTKTAPDEVLSSAQSRARIRSSLKAIFDRMSEAPVPILLMIGTPSVHGGVSDGAYIEPCLGCNSLAPSKVRDYQQQADLYQAACEAINESPTGNGRVMGLMTWGYQFRDDFTRGTDPGDSAYDKSASIRGKPAEAVLRSWFDRWTGTRPEVARPPAIAGAWSSCASGAACNSVFVFLENGAYYQIQDASVAQGPAGFDGFERGTYTWNPGTGGLTVTTIKDTNGDLGLSGLNAVAGLTFNVAGNGATLTRPGKSPVAQTRVTGTPIVGAWFAGSAGADPDSSCVVFFQDGTYLAMQDGIAEGAGQAGIEHGTYAWSSDMGAFVLDRSASVVDTNGDWGLSPHPELTMRVSADLLTITFVENLHTSSATRVRTLPPPRRRAARH